MSGLDITICVHELSELSGSWVGKIYQINKLFLIRLNHPDQGKKDLVIEPGNRIHLTEMKHETPQHPPSFAMLLRKHLSNTKLTKVRQPDFERIVEIKFESNGKEFSLIAELFGEGNLILCNGNGEIVQPQKRKSWEHREIRPGATYKQPPKRGQNIHSISERELGELLSKAPDLVRGLAQNLNIGGQLAEEICIRAEIDKETKTDNLTETQIKRIYFKIVGLLSQSISPRIVYRSGEPIDVTPFHFLTNDKLEIEKFDSYNKALDHYFQAISKLKSEEKKEDRLEEKLGAVKSRLKKQRNHLQELKETTNKTQKKADLISTYHEKIDKALQKIKEISKNRGWENLKDQIKSATNSGKEWAKIVEDVNPKQGKAKLKLQEKEVTLNFRKTSFENASKLYDKSKKSKKKIKGAKKAVEKTKKELKSLKETGLEEPQEKVFPKKTREKKWYEKYRWFLSSDDLLVIGGRDQKTNQEVVEKHMDLQDKYLHADMQGAPHVVIKGNDEKIPESTIEEAARFAAMHSKAWREGLASLDVYWVEPNQVSKEAPAGEYLPKGSYMIRGERNYMTVPLVAALGLATIDGNEVPICGPPNAVKAHSETLIKIKPGSTKKSKLAHELKKILEKEKEVELEIDELMQILPPGPGMTVD